VRERVSEISDLMLFVGKYIAKVQWIILVLNI